jgi:hypothetical protein
VVIVGDVAGAEVVPDDAHAASALFVEVLGGVGHEGQVVGWQ